MTQPLLGARFLAAYTPPVEADLSLPRSSPLASITGGPRNGEERSSVKQVFEAATEADTGGRRPSFHGALEHVWMGPWLHMAVMAASASASGGGPSAAWPIASGLRLATALPYPSPCFRAQALIAPRSFPAPNTFVPKPWSP